MNQPTISTTFQSNQRSSRLTSGAITLWLLFSAIAVLIALIALPGVGRLYDFRSFYAAGFLVLHSPNYLFDLPAQDAVQNAIVYPMKHGVPFYHPAFEALLYAPFTLLPYRAAYFTYIACNLLLLAACYSFAPPVCDQFLRKAPPAAFFFLAFPALMCVIQGQDSILFLLILCFVWRSLDNENAVIAGALLALALFKLQIVLSLTFFLAISLRRRLTSRLLLGFFPVAAILAITSVAITGVSGTAQWLNRLATTAVASHFGHQAQSIAAIVPESMPSLNGLLYVLGTRTLPPHVAIAVDVFASIVIFTAALAICIRVQSLAVAFSVALIASLLLAPHLFLYDYLALIFPLLLLKQRALPLIAGLYYLTPVVLCGVDKLRWTAVMAFIPLALLLTIAGEISLHAPEKVTPHPLTSVE